MQRDSPPSWPAGAGDYPMMGFSGQSTDDFCFDAMSSGLSLQTFVGLHENKSLLSLLNCGTSAFPVADGAGLGLPGGGFSSFQQGQVGECLKELRAPKVELVDGEETTGESSEPLKLTSDSFSMLCDSSFHHLPELHSLEQASTHAESSHKRPRSSSPTDSYTLEAIVKSFKLSNYLSASCKSADVLPLPAVPAVPQHTMAKQRRQKISDKTRCLQRLMPWDRKMDMATMLEEAYKYIKFLQAQIRALQTMPSDSNFVHSSPVNETGALTGLKRLNRQQLLQVLVNSPGAQTMLYSKGCCVFSMEQLMLLKKLSESRRLLQNLLFDSPKLS